MSHGLDMVMEMHQALFKVNGDKEWKDSKRLHRKSDIGLSRKSSRHYLLLHIDSPAKSCKFSKADNKLQL